MVSIREQRVRELYNPKLSPMENARLASEETGLSVSSCGVYALLMKKGIDHSAYKQGRKKGTGSGGNHRLAPTAPSELIRISPIVEQDADVERRISLVYSLLQRMGYNDRRVIEAYFFENRTLEEIGREIGGVKRESVRIRKNRVLSRLRADLLALEGAA